MKARYHRQNRCQGHRCLDQSSQSGFTRPGPRGTHEAHSTAFVLTATSPRGVKRRPAHPACTYLQPYRSLFNILCCHGAGRKPLSTAAPVPVVAESRVWVGQCCSPTTEQPRLAGIKHIERTARLAAQRRPTRWTARSPCPRSGPNTWAQSVCALDWDEEQQSNEIPVSHPMHVHP